MAPMERFWACITYVLSYLSFSPIGGLNGQQQTAILPSTISPHHDEPGYPIFKPPGGRLRGEGSNFTCEYPEMIGWSSCSTPENRRCWLRNDKTGEEINIETNYEDTNKTPFGIHRTYEIDIEDTWINVDGMNFSDAKLFKWADEDKFEYPGPWIQGCWGDNITVIVNNNLRHNGTSIHWHGIRQWLTMHMDGVNGVTQCPIAPGDSFNYTFRAMQYGSAWYHSHYSVQYADGALGPLTLHGPTWQPYDEAKTPILMTDWGHNSAFEALFTGKLKGNNILLNGKGNVTRFNNAVPAELEVPEMYQIHFNDSIVDDRGHKRPKRYLLRVINTAFDSTFVFSIDNHKLNVVGADFVPIHNYTTTSILIGIGQRYHVIVEANPDAAGGTLPSDGNFWIRTWKADCFRFNQSKASPGYETTGILRYDNKSTSLPTTRPWDDVRLNCSDEDYKNLQPVIPWTVGPPANIPTNTTGDKTGQHIGIDAISADTMYPLAEFSMEQNDGFMPLRVDYGNPTFLNLGNHGPWHPQWVVLNEDFNGTDWVYLVIKGRTAGETKGAHPIHLHGHDFALLAQVENATFPTGLNLKTTNPPRRDVVLLPTNGYVVIAFKTDNPGTWLVHCHIAKHAGMGLAMQINERQKDAQIIWPNLTSSDALKTVKKGCDRWNEWWGNCSNWWAPKGENNCKLGATLGSPDSGI